MMERLTTKLEDGNFIPTALCGIGRDGEVDDIDGCKDYCDKCREECSKCAIQKCFNKLAEYENLEKRGLLKRFPCKVGDTAWLVDSDNYPIEIVITRIEITENYVAYRAKEKEGCGTLGFDSDDFGKTIFLTQVEAEQKLKEMDGKS